MGRVLGIIRGLSEGIGSCNSYLSDLAANTVILEPVKDIV